MWLTKLFRGGVARQCEAMEAELRNLSTIIAIDMEKLRKERDYLKTKLAILRPDESYFYDPADATVYETTESRRPAKMAGLPRLFPRK